MSAIRDAIEEVKHYPKDERIERARQSSSSTATITLFLCYLAIAFVYTVQGKLVPFSTQFLFI
jgi:hypothetical protein